MAGVTTNEWEQSKKNVVVNACVRHLMLRWMAIYWRLGLVIA